MIKSSLRAFLGMLFGFFGLVVGIVVIALVLGAMSGGKREIDGPTKVTVIPNHKGEKGSLSAHSPLILLLDISGVIGIQDLNIETIRPQIERSYAFEKGRIKGLLLTINSPGGGVTDSFAIYNLIKQYKEELGIPVLAYADGYCASGGFLIACAADKIVATPVSVIGSVGVRSTVFNVADTLEKLGVKAKMLSQGTDKGNLDPFIPWKEGDDEGAKEVMAGIYDLFLDAVTANRPQMTRDKLINDYGARAYVAATAKEYGYIDGLVTTRRDALRTLADALEITDKEYQVIELTAKSWLEELVKSKSPLITGRLQHSVEVPPTVYN
ncbi:MAG: S49 family peptidase [Parachlamydiales bacterium]